MSYCKAEMHQIHLRLGSAPDPTRGAYSATKTPYSCISGGNKSVEIVFTTKRKRQLTPPPLLCGITRVMTMKMLIVTISDKLSVSDHVQNIVSSCAQSVHAIRTLRAHGMCQ